MLHIARATRPVRLRLTGQFWDVQLYSGTLVLFRRDSAISTLDWDRLIGDLQVPAELALAREAAFQGGRQFYAEVPRRILQDVEVHALMVSKFSRLRDLLDSVEVDPSPYARTVRNPFPFPHNDSDCHYATLYVGTAAGVFRGGAPQSAGASSTRLTDIPCLDIAAKHGAVAVAAGSEGLHELRNAGGRCPELRPVAERVCSTCEWSYESLVGSNHGRSLFVALYKYVTEKVDGERNRRVREPIGVVSGLSLFDGDEGGSSEAIEWGAKNRLYSFKAGKFSATERQGHGEQVRYGLLEPGLTSFWFEPKRLVTVEAAPFGSVFEFDDSLEVLLNTGATLSLAGEPVSWRVYPRSQSYLHHLHVIYDDHVDILCFVDDYFVPQNERYFGTEPVSEDERGRNSYW